MTPTSAAPTPASSADTRGKIPGFSFNIPERAENILHGAKTYRLNIPANAPAKDPSKNNKRDKLIVNGDGSVDLYFGPKAPDGKEANWTETVPGKSWFVILRLYGPLEAWFERAWRPGEIEQED